MAPAIDIIGSHNGDEVISVAASWNTEEGAGDAQTFASWCMILVEMCEPGLSPEVREDILVKSGVLRGESGSYKLGAWQYRFSTASGMMFIASPAG